MPLVGDPATFLTFRGVRYVESDESPSGNYARGKGTVTRSYYCGWEDKDALALAMAGTTSVQTAPGGKRYLSRVTPHALPYKTRPVEGVPVPYMYCDDVLQVRPMALRGNDGGTADGLGVARYQQAEVTCQYSMPTFSVREDADVHAADGPLAGLPDEGHVLATLGAKQSRYVAVATKFTTRELVSNRGLMKDANGKVILEGVPIREATGEATYTWYNVPEAALPRAAWVAGGATVNDQEFDRWPAGTLLASGLPEVRPEPNVVDGELYYTLVYRFQLLMLYDRDPALAGGPVIRGHNYIRRLTTRVPLADKVFEPVLVTTTGENQTEFQNVDPDRLMFPPFPFASFFRPDQP